MDRIIHHSVSDIHSSTKRALYLTLLHIVCLFNDAGCPDKIGAAVRERIQLRFYILCRHSEIIRGD